jgi:polar amino acid transport system substrate-binding protein
VLNLATEADYPPDEFSNRPGGEIVGLDIDLARGIAANLGLKLVITNVAEGEFAQGLADGRWNLLIGGLLPVSAPGVAWVTYLRTGVAVYSRGAVPASLCGLALGVRAGDTTPLRVALAASATCSHPPRVVTFSQFVDGNLALAEGKIAAIVADYPVAVYQVHGGDGLFRLGPTMRARHYAIATTPALAPAIASALRAMIANGSYGAILARWDVSAGALSAPRIAG